MIRIVNPGSRILMLTVSHPGSRDQKGTQLRIPDPDPQHCEKGKNYIILLQKKDSSIKVKNAVFKAH
jgi:hypothetical protein